MRRSYHCRLNSHCSSTLCEGNETRHSTTQQPDILQDQGKLFMFAMLMQERSEFLMKYRHGVLEEDFEVAMKAYEWPKKFVTIMKEAASKAALGMPFSRQQAVFCCIGIWPSLLLLPWLQAAYKIFSVPVS